MCSRSTAPVYDRSGAPARGEPAEPEPSGQVAFSEKSDHAYARLLAHFPDMPSRTRHRAGAGPPGVADATAPAGLRRPSGQARHRPERTVGDVVVEVLV